ncbi:flagellar biosynthesis protein FlhF, partial [Bordetella bronchiseptica]
AQARSDWRAAMAGPATARALGDAGLALARQAYPAASSRYLLAMHGKAALRAAGLPQATLLSALLMSDRGAALAAPAQQLMLQHGLLAAYAPGEPAGANPIQALLARTDYLSGALAQLPHVHVFDAGSAPPWQALAGQDAGWLARCAGATRVQQDLCPTLLRAVARGLGYLPVGNVAVPGKGSAPLALWAGSADVSLAARGQAPLAVRMVSARLLDPSSGRQVAQWFGLTNLAATQADAATLARWLVQYEQARGAFRYMAHAWAALPPDAGDAAALAARALAAGQLGAACWQLEHQAQAAAMRQALPGLLGPGARKTPARLAPAALMKLFALLEMAG